MNKYILILTMLAFVSCKKDKNVKPEEKKVEVVKKDVLTKEDKKTDKILEEGKFIALSEGVDLVVNKNEILVILPNTGENAKSRYFLHVSQKNKEKIILDFDIKKANLKSLNKYKNYFVCYRYINETIDASKPYSINIGKIDKEKGRLWSKFLFVEKIKTKYDYRYYKNIDTVFKNEFDKELEEALNDGYFIKRMDGFDMLFNNQILYFIKQNASEEDLKTRFFLHVGVEGTTKKKNQDFNFNQHKKYSTVYPKLSIAKVNLGDDAISFATGQINKKGRVWSVSYTLDKIVNNASLVYDNQYDE